MVFRKPFTACLFGVADRQDDDICTRRDLDRLGDQRTVFHRVCQQHLVHGSVFALRDEHALRMHYLCLSGELGSDAIQQRHRLPRDGRIAAQTCNGRIRPDDGNAPMRSGGQRQS